ncbi:MAG: ArnT family glycosyltransferase, partial [Polyangiaceae bacterium]
AGNVMAAEQMLKWHIIYPAWEWYSGSPPDHGAYICHHPFGQYYVPAVLLGLFGHHDFVARLAGTLMSVPVPPLLYGIAKEKWGRPAGAVAAASYVVLPLAVGFSQFTNLEAFCIFGALLFFWGHTRHLVTGRKRHLVAALAGVAFACAGDWAGYLLITPAIIWFFLRAFVVPRRLLPRFHFEPYAREWGLAVGLVAGTLLFWLGLFAYAGQIDAWVMAAFARGGGSSFKLSAVLATRKDWIDFSFTPLAILLGKIAAPVALLRLLVMRRDEEIYSLSLLFGATFQYVVFKAGADVHIFWSLYFAPYYALAMAQLFGTGAGLVGFVVGRFMREWRASVVAWVTLAAGILPALVIAPDGVRSLWVWRRTGGRYDDNGALTRSHLDLLDVVDQIVLPNTYRGNPIDTSASAEWYWEHTWLYQGPNVDKPLPESSDPGAA